MYPSDAPPQKQVAAIHATNGASTSGIHHTLATLHHKVFAVGAFWDSNAENMYCDWLLLADDGNGLKGFGLKPQSIQDCIDSGMNEG